MPPTYEELQVRVEQLEKQLQDEKAARAADNRRREQVQNAVNLLMNQQAYASWLAERRSLQLSFRTCREQALTPC